MSRVFSDEVLFQSEMGFKARFEGTKFLSLGLEMYVYFYFR